MILALDDVGAAGYAYATNGYENRLLTNYHTPDFNDFGYGKQWTRTYIDNWNSSKFGSHGRLEVGDILQNYPLYSVYSSKNTSGQWYLPSRAELSACMDYLYSEMGLTVRGNTKYGLEDYYITCATYDNRYVYEAKVKYGEMDTKGCDVLSNIRLVTTF